LEVTTQKDLPSGDRVALAPGTCVVGSLKFAIWMESVTENPSAAMVLALMTEASTKQAQRYFMLKCTVHAQHEIARVAVDVVIDRCSDSLVVHAIENVVEI
jgi:hypothetical protein